MFQRGVSCCCWLRSVIYEFLFLRRRRPPRSTRTDTRFPSTTLFRSTVVRDGRSGLLVDGHDTLVWADAIGRVALDPAFRDRLAAGARRQRSEEHTSGLQSLMRISYAVFCLKKKKKKTKTPHTHTLRQITDTLCDESNTYRQTIY